MITTPQKQIPRTEDKSPPFEDRVAELQRSSTEYRNRIQSASAAERALPAAAYVVGRAALDQAMQILGPGRFHDTTDQAQVSGDAVQPEAAS